MIIGTRVFLCRNFEHLRQTKDLALCLVSVHDLTGYEKTHALYQGTTKQLAEKLSGRRARLRTLRKNYALCQFVHDATYEKPLGRKGPALHAVEKLMFCITARLNSLRKSSCFLKGTAFRPCVNALQ
jgi:hypothetical protein